ncbi:hypothetical protein AB0J71_31790 [Nonomuraea sp. NPDC049637]|uniref:hypothetical protein n=1 Tax=Nonomuraea sp. NPDC049637 TaxID=3154356 RepID=UPI003431FDA8
MTVDTYGPSDLTAYLTSSGVLDPGTARHRVWLRAFEAVPRHLFVPSARGPNRRAVGPTI